MGRNNPAEAKGKTERQQTILRLIQEHPISRQEVLLEHLRQEGFEVTQATISRDIRELCLVKAATADGYRYVSSHNESQPQDAGPVRDDIPRVGAGGGFCRTCRAGEVLLRHGERCL